MTDEERFDAQPIYCPTCDENYTLAWSTEKDKMYAVCGCEEAEHVVDFRDRFIDEYTEHEENTAPSRGYQ